MPYKLLLVNQTVTVSELVLQTKEDCWLSKRRCRDQATDVHPIHWIMATGESDQNKQLLSVSFTKLYVCVSVSVCRQWASCSFLITSPTAWSTSLTWWMIFGIMLETGPQTWVDPIILDPCVLPMPSSPPFTITHAISGLLPPGLPPSQLPYYRAPMAFFYPEVATVSSQSFLLRNENHPRIFRTPHHDATSRMWLFCNHSLKNTFLYPGFLLTLPSVVHS